MPKKQSDTKPQTARALGGDEDEAAFEEKLRRIAAAKPKPKPKQPKPK